MKLSNNALNFLLAQYRAIFKRAYVKGLASAVILTAGLATGAAQAANDYASIDAINSAAQEGEEFEIDGVNDFATIRVPTTGATLDTDLSITTGTTKRQFIVGNGTATDKQTNVLDGNGHNLTITGSGEDNDKGFIFGSAEKAWPKLQIKDLGILTIDGATVNLNTADSGTNSQGNQVGVDVGADRVVISGGAKVNLNNNTSKNANTANTFLRGTVMEVTGADTVVNIGNSDLSGSTTTKNSKAVFGYEEEYNDDGSLKYSGSDITVTDATLNLQGGLTGIIWGVP